MLGPDRCTHAHAHVFLGRYTFVEKPKDVDSTARVSTCTAACEKSADRPCTGGEPAKGAGWYGTDFYPGGQVCVMGESVAGDCKKGDGGCLNPKDDSLPPAAP